MTIEAMQWNGFATKFDDLSQYAADEIVARINANGGEARYEPHRVIRISLQEFDQPPRIAVRTVDGWAYMAPGDVAVMGETYWDPNDRPGGVARDLLASLDEIERLLGLVQHPDIYDLQERGLRVLGDEQCCELACDGGACGSCPCCCAGWCVNGHTEIPERDLTPGSDYRIWLETAMRHNPTAKLLAQIEGADEPVRELGGQP